MNSDFQPFQQQKEVCRVPTLGGYAEFGIVFEFYAAKKSNRESILDILNPSLKLKTEKDSTDDTSRY